MTTTAAARRQLVTFETERELFAVDIAAVERVLRYSAPRGVPNTAPWLRGVIAQGDRLVPVLDLRERLALPGALNEERARILVIRLDDGPMGVVVDAVHEVLSVDPTAVEAPPIAYRGLVKEFVQGIVQRDDQLFVLLDLARLVTSTERLALREAVASEGGNGG